ncbi:hypothetical protein PAXRUDRAFT_49094, partial [Paxillus rubicundulus Ve08.2h10]
KQSITKSNFVSIYAQAHLQALTPDNICAAFQKMGAWPFNPDVVTKEMMAPSFETSSVGRLPLPQPSPVCTISAAIHQYQMECMTTTATPAHPGLDNPFHASANAVMVMPTPTTQHPPPAVSTGWHLAAEEAA